VLNCHEGIALKEECLIDVNRDLIGGLLHKPLDSPELCSPARLKRRLKSVVQLNEHCWTCLDGEYAASGLEVYDGMGALEGAEGASGELDLDPPVESDEMFGSRGDLDEAFSDDTDRVVVNGQDLRGIQKVGLCDELPELVCGTFAADGLTKDPAQTVNRF
jgi:hypothetical protein